MKIIIAGGNGQIGQALQATLSNHDIISVDLPEVDISNKTAVFDLITAEQPAVVINSAAYTNVDGCAKNPGLAYQANALGPQNLALACRETGASLVQISTNEVFDGRNPTGYQEWMPLNPINPYGSSKAAGEFNVRSVLPQHYIVRTAWVYSAIGRNFVHAILQRGRETGQVRVVTDEIGNPTFATDVARAIAQLIETKQYGTYHFVNQGSCSRWEFANEVLRLAGIEATNEPILGSEFKRASTPPPFGTLHNSAGAAIGIILRPWQEALQEFINGQLAIDR